MPRLCHGWQKLLRLKPGLPSFDARGDRIRPSRKFCVPLMCRVSRTTVPRFCRAVLRRLIGESRAAASKLVVSTTVLLVPSVNTSGPRIADPRMHLRKVITLARPDNPFLNRRFLTRSGQVHFEGVSDYLNLLLFGGLFADVFGQF